MNNQAWIVIDCNSLCHRAWHVMGDMSHNGQRTGAIFGLLRDISTLQEHLGSSNMIFCFDSDYSLRAKIYPQYKANRTKEGKQSLYSQIDLLKSSILRDIGFSNIASLPGYEADDLLACFAEDTLKDSEVILVTRDHDMHQCLTQDGRVMCYDPQIKSWYGWGMFVAEWNLTPPELPKVMALMGCKTDNIEGIRGVGPETAVKIVKGEPISDSIKARYKFFCDEGKYERNLKLIELPFSELGIGYGISELGIGYGILGKDVVIREDTVTQQKWNMVCEQYGLQSLVPRCPYLRTVYE